MATTTKTIAITTTAAATERRHPHHSSNKNRNPNIINSKSLKNAERPCKCTCTVLRPAWPLTTTSARLYRFAFSVGYSNSSNSNSIASAQTPRNNANGKDVAENNGPLSISSSNSNMKETHSSGASQDQQPPNEQRVRQRRRRSKRDKQLLPAASNNRPNKKKSNTKRRKPSDSDANQKSGGVMALLPSLFGLAVLGCGLMAKMGFRGRASVAGIDLGTTNSVVCVQAPAKGVGVIDCILDKSTNSSIIPSVVSFLEPNERPVGPKSKTPSLLYPHPSAVVVGQAAKRRIDSHPHHTLYNAKRVLGRPAGDAAITELKHEVEFEILEQYHSSHYDEEDDDYTPVAFRVPDSERPVPPEQVGGYVVDYLMQLTRDFLGHDNVKSAVICVPAKFNAYQRQQTARAFALAGIKVARVVEEPTAAALAYGLHRKAGVDYILVYDFGGGTLDVSLLHVSDGFVDVMGSDGDDFLGGADFDAAVAHFLMGEEEEDGHNDDNDDDETRKRSLEKKQIVSLVSTVLHDLETLSEKQSQPTSSSLDLEQQLSHSCPDLQETPLCTTSSFHTLGEQLKISLSELTLARNEAALRKGEVSEEEELEEEEAKVNATCLGLQQNDAQELLELMSKTTKEEQSSSSVFLQHVEAFCQRLQPQTLEMTATEYQTAVQPLLDRSSLPVRRLLQDLDLTEDDIDEVVMVGGTSRMPQIRDLVKKVLPSAALNTHIDPDITVAYGAASVID
mmetsp:Transcript_10535/g.23304  ORF Transcript_10535/g.23304 Transcript_10535/m.23304 type:complete len:733 (-) Transcript_10535:1773-3971(-)